MAERTKIARGRAAKAFFWVTASMAALAGHAAAGELQGRVSDGSGVRSLAGAEITLPEANRNAVTDSAGQFRIVNLPAGQYRVIVRYVGAAPVEQTVTVGADGVARIDVRVGEQTANVTDSIIVVGQRGNQAGALSRQRTADIVQSVLTRDAIGQFPDQNVSESVRRLPSVAVANDQGEGRFVSVRGLDPDLNTTSVNGARLPSPEAGIRAVALDTLPTEGIESIEVHRTLTPDRDADAIGGSIEIRTISALDRTGNHFGGSLEGSYNDLVGEWSPRGSLDASVRVNDRLGLSASISYSDRDLGSDNVEADDWVYDGGINRTYSAALEYRDYIITRERLTGTASLDLDLTPNTRIFLRGVASEFSDQEFRSRLELEQNSSNPTAGPTATSVAFGDAGGTFRVQRDIKDRLETQRIFSLVAGGETEINTWDLEYSVSWSTAEEIEDDRLDTRYRWNASAANLDIVQDYSNPEVPTFTVSAGTLANFNNPALYTFNRIENSTGTSTDEEWGFRFDARNNTTILGHDGYYRLGVRGRFREKDYDLNLVTYGSGQPGLTNLSQFFTTVDHRFATLGPLPSADPLRNFIEANRAGFTADADTTTIDSAAADYRSSENIAAAYGMAQIDFGDLRVTGGVRVEGTQFETNGFTVQEDPLLVTPVQATNSYTDWLPSINLRWEPVEDLVFRGAITRSVVRPRIGDASATVLVNDDNEADPGDIGNPELDPFRAWNFDLGAEWYFGRNAIAQIGLFHKDIEGFIFQRGVDDETIRGVFVDEGFLPVNGGDATVTGIELNYQQVLDFLPGPFGGLLVGLNYTYTDSEATLPSGRSIRLPGSSDQTANITLGYERGPLSLRLTGNYRSEYLEVVEATVLDNDGTDEALDRWIDGQWSVDVSARYRITPGVTVYAEAVNLTDEPLYAYFPSSRGNLLSQYEEYSWTSRVGVRVSY